MKLPFPYDLSAHDIALGELLQTTEQVSNHCMLCNVQNSLIVNQHNFNELLRDCQITIATCVI